MDSISFPFRYLEIPAIGKIFVPYVSVGLNTLDGVVEYDFIVDTGSDLTTLPHYMANRLNIDLSNAKTSEAEGIGGHRIKTWLTTVDLVFSNTTIKVRASVTNENSTPFLLGRVDLLDTLCSWNFNSTKKKIEFEKL